MGIDLNAENFESEVIQSDKPVLVDFWGPRCGPCLALMPSVEALPDKYNGIKITKVDASKNRRLCLSMKVMSLPTFLFYKNAKEVERLTGNDLTIDKIEESVKKLLA